jgi:anti-anti-sigma factor
LLAQAASHVAAQPRLVAGRREQATIERHMTDASDVPLSFEVRLEPRRERLVVVPRGELDIQSAERLRSAMREQFDSGFEHVVADLREVSFIDSSGIRVLWQEHQHAEGAGVRLSLIPGSGEVGRALRMTGLLERMHLAE